MYLLYESLYGDLLVDCNSTDIIGLYDSREKAVKKAEKLIKEDIEQNDYVLEIDNNFNDSNCVRLFWRRQENWGCYYEMIIKKIEVE